MILSLLSLLGGGLMRLLPEVFAFLNKKADNGHELAMMDKQLALEQLKGQQQAAITDMQTNAEQIVHMFDAQAEALKTQMQVTGMKFVDALNFLVRPLTTYYVLAMYGAAKVAKFMLMWQDGTGTWQAIDTLYTADDLAILSGVLGFWFVGRVFDRLRK